MSGESNVTIVFLGLFQMLPAGGHRNESRRLLSGWFVPSVVFRRAGHNSTNS